jgi:hypothetical protein
MRTRSRRFGEIYSAFRCTEPLWLNAGFLCHYGLMPPTIPDPDEPPPFLGTWRRVYAAILIYLSALIAGFYLFTRAYR